MFKRLLPYIAVAVVSMAAGSIMQPLSYLPAGAQPGCRTFPETGKNICGRFLHYWQSHGGLAQQGYPLSNEFTEVSELNGRLYTVQYFERAVFEYHPENAIPNDVLLSLLGTFQFRKKYPDGEPGSAQPIPTPPSGNAPAGPEAPVTLLRPGATITLSIDPLDPTRLGYGCEQGEMLWIWNIHNNSNEAITIDLDRGTVSQLDSTGRAYMPAPNCRGHTFVYAFEQPTTIPPGTSGRAALVMSAEGLPPGATHFDLYMTISGQPLAFRFPLR